MSLYEITVHWVDHEIFIILIDETCLASCFVDKMLIDLCNLIQKTKIIATELGYKLKLGNTVSSITIQIF